MAIAVDDDRLRAARMNAQLLMGPPAAGVVGAVRGAGALQAQDAQAARLAVRARTTGLVAGDVRRAVAEDRSIVRTWAMRGTLHALPASDVGWVVDLLGPVFVQRFRKRRADLGLDDELCERAEDALRDILAGGTALTRARLVEELNRAGVPVPETGQAPAHLVAYAALRGILCRGPDAVGGGGAGGDESTYVLMREWVGPWEARDTDSALTKLARRYLWSHGLAAPEDFAAWSGLPAAQVRRGWELVSGELAEVSTSRGTAWATREFAEALPGPGSVPAVRMVGGFDAYLLGYRDRDTAVPRRHARRIVPGGGIIRPTVLVDGRAAARWRWGRDRVTVVVEPFEAFPAELLGALEAEVADIGRFLGIASARLDLRDADSAAAGGDDAGSADSAGSAHEPGAAEGD